MAPQLPGFNRAIWRGLENREREWSKRKGKLYVLTGPVFSNSTISTLNRVLIPSHFYKIILNPRDGRAISFLIPHKALKTASLGLYTVSVDDIEQATELDFFSDFSDREEDLFESKVSSLNW
jgi:endonuclease G